MAGDIDWDKLKQARITMPITALFVIAVGGWQGVGWFNDFHVGYLTVANAEESFEQIQTSIDGNAKVMGEHINEYKLNEAGKAIQHVRDQQFQLLQWVDTNGANTVTNDRQRELGERLDKLTQYRDCVLTGGTNCDTLRP